MEKLAQIHKILNFYFTFFSNRQIFMISSSMQPKNIEQFFFLFLFLFFLLSYLACSQIWLNYFVNDQHFGYMTKSLKGNLAPTVKAQWRKSGGQKRDIRALKMLSPIRICWRIHKQSMENLTQQRSFMCAEHYTHGGLHTRIYGIWNVLQGTGVYTLTTFHTIPY